MKVPKKMSIKHQILARIRGFDRRSLSFVVGSSSSSSSWWPLWAKAAMIRERRMREKRIGRAIVVVGHLDKWFVCLKSSLECSTDWVEEKQESIVHEQDQIAKRRCTTYNKTFMAETFWSHYDRDLNRLFLKQERLLDFEGLEVGGVACTLAPHLLGAKKSH